MTAPESKPVPPTFTEVPRFNRNTLPLGDWQYFRKRRATQMTRINGPFVVESAEGPLLCRDGWLALDSHGDPYPISAGEQERSYELLEGQLPTVDDE